MLAIPAKRGERALVSFLLPAEVDALLASPDRSRRLGRRDHALLVLALQTGLRVSELSTLHLEDLHLGTGAFVHCAGKGRKERATPLTKLTVTVMKDYLAERGGQDTDPVFAGPGGQPLGRDAIRRLVERHAASAARACPSLSRKKPTPHTLRHTCAMRLLESGTDIATIGLWLGHASSRTTEIYLHAHLALKERAIERTAPPALPLAATGRPTGCSRSWRRCDNADNSRPVTVTARPFVLHAALSTGLHCVRNEDFCITNTPSGSSRAPSGLTAKVRTPPERPVGTPGHGRLRPAAHRPAADCRPAPPLGAAPGPGQADDPRPGLPRISHLLPPRNPRACRQTHRARPPTSQRLSPAPRPGDPPPSPGEKPPNGQARNRKQRLGRTTMSTQFESGPRNADEPMQPSSHKPAERSKPDTAQFAVSGGNSTGYGWPESAERLTSRHLRSSPRSCSSSRIEASAAITPSGRW